MTCFLQRSGGDIRISDSKGLLYILDEESIFPGATINSFLERLQFHARNNDILRGTGYSRRNTKTVVCIAELCRQATGPGLP